MNAYEKIEKLDGKEYKLITGVTRETFNKMLVVLKREYAKVHDICGAKGKPVEVRLTIALEYWREYRSIRHMANDHQIPKSTINEMILWVENILLESKEFKLKDLKERFEPGEESDVKIIIVDVEEQPIERPKVSQEKSYSGKKTSHNEISNRNKSKKQRDTGRV